MPIYSRITLHDRRGRWMIKIEHNDRVVESGRHENAADAYAEAEAKLVYKPGYVQAIPIGDR